MKTIQHTILAAGLLAASAASAAINIDTVFVGNAGNANDSTGYGGVSYDYHIGTYEVTNSQYTAFLNATAATDTHSLYNTNMGSSTHGGINRAGSSGSYTYSVKSGFGDKPVNFVSFWDAARFSNWLTSGTTETGVYNLYPIGIANNTITRDAAAWAAGGVAIASENEWYKAAYYSGSPTGADGDGYWLYPTQSNSITTADANYDNFEGIFFGTNSVTDVGSYSDNPSYYGTFDQGGNVGEWNDVIVSTSSRGLRGGSYRSNNTFLLTDDDLQSSFRGSGDPTGEESSLGFRVSSMEAIPEPSAIGLVLGSMVFLLAQRRRQRN